MTPAGDGAIGPGYSAPGVKKQLSFVLLLAACFIDGVDLQLLPSSFRALEADLGLTLFTLGQLAMIQALFMAALCPFWGSAADMGLYSKRFLLTVGITGWGISTILLGTVTNFYAMMILRAFVGGFLACILPISQTMIACEVQPFDRGRIFGWVTFAQLMGRVISSMFTTSISNKIFLVLGVPLMGWRVAFFAIGFLSLLLAGVVYMIFEEPPPSRRAGNDQGILSDVARRARSYFHITTFRLIVFQGLFGGIPWQALSFLPMFLQYAGFQDELAATLTTFLMLGCAIGAIFGGCLGDLAAQWSKLHGRIIVAQVSISAGIPCMAMMFHYVQPISTNFWAFACVLWCCGLLASWTPSVKRVILTEIVRQEDWASLFALDTALEGCSASLLGTPMVSLLAERAFGYTPMSEQVTQMPTDMRTHNVHALGKAMLWMTVLPWTLCMLNWIFMHRTYPVDIKAMENGHETEDDFEAVGEDAPLLKGDDDGCMAY